VTGTRRFSQAISEGDGISIVVPVDDPESASAAEEQGAEALVLHTQVESIREATTLPLLWRPHGSHDQALAAEADAFVLAFAELADENGELEQAYRSALELGLECAVEVRDEAELEAALERVDPEIFLLVAGEGGDEGPVQRALDLLQDVPAGKLAIAELPASGRDEVAELERAGMDAVIVPGGNVAELVGGNHPDV
jgi:indole-3-glycerol phosphate synthase